mmetsp:Transcript_2795/g.8790  ORF Transcript_2795/g.8790 Transcript_2795/m.8790 type:complete len:100 (+) Transcript_2795:2979-3278(+)
MRCISFLPMLTHILFEMGSAHDSCFSTGAKTGPPSFLEPHCFDEYGKGIPKQPAYALQQQGMGFVSIRLRTGWAEEHYRTSTVIPFAQLLQFVIQLSIT